jgi:hypothetical protein
MYVSECVYVCMYLCMYECDMYMSYITNACVYVNLCRRLELYKNRDVDQAVDVYLGRVDMDALGEYPEFDLIVRQGINSEWITDGDSILNTLRAKHDDKSLVISDESIDSIPGSERPGVRERAVLRFQHGHYDVDSIAMTHATIQHSAHDGATIPQHLLLCLELLPHRQ